MSENMSKESQSGALIKQFCFKNIKVRADVKYTEVKDLNVAIPSSNPIFGCFAACLSPLVVNHYCGSSGSIKTTTTKKNKKQKNSTRDNWIKPRWYVHYLLQRWIILPPLHNQFTVNTSRFEATTFKPS